MAKRAKDVIGKPIVSATSGEKLGTVDDLLLDETGQTIVGLVVTHGLMRREAVLPASAIRSIGRDAVISGATELLSAAEWKSRESSPNDHDDDDPAAPARYRA